jgi:hypothetical protein
VGLRSNRSCCWRLEDGVVLNFYAAGSVHVDAIRLVRDPILRDFDDEVVLVRQVACDKSQAAGSRKHNACQCAFKLSHNGRRRRRNHFPASPDEPSCQGKARPEQD